MTGPPLRVLHLFANFKWTGPADPAIRCAARLRELGADVVFAQARWTLPGAEHRMRTELARWRLPVAADLELRKHFHVPSLLRDAKTLRERLRRGDFDVLHCHLLGDHLLAALARRGAGRRVVVIRTLYDPEPPRRDLRHRIALRGTDGLVAPTARCAQAAARQLGFPASRVLVQEPPVEPRPRDEAAAAAMRQRWGFCRGDFAIGITARIQPHRRFDLLWQTARAVLDRAPQARFVLLGRGNERDRQALVEEPLRRLGLAPRVALPGYLYEPEYGAALGALDAFLFLVPGSDGTCRAVREAMAAGLPVVATRRGILPELLEADAAAPCGVVCDASPEALSAVLVELAGDPGRRARLGAAALAKTRGPMDPTAAARRLWAFYNARWDDAQGGAAR